MTETDLLTLPAAEFTDPTTAAQIKRQVRWEVDAADRGIRRYHEAQAKAAELGLTSAGQKIIQEAVQPLAKYISDAQEALIGVPTRGTAEWYVYLCAVEAKQLAYLTLRTITSTKPSELTTGGARNLKECAKDLARRVQLQIAYEDWIAEDRAAAREARALGVAYQRQYAAFLRKNKTADARSVQRWFARLHRAWKQPWPETQIFAFGYALIKWAVDHGGGLFEFRDVPRGGKTERFVALADGGRQFMRDHDARAEVARPLDRPMLCSPKAWTWDTQMKRYSGGYYLHKRPLVRADGLNGHTGDLERPFSDETLAAINVVQSVPWRINTLILDAMREAWLTNQVVGKMPRPDNEPLPARAPDAVWAAMSKAQRTAYKAEREAIHARNAALEGKRFSWLARMDIATDVADEPAIYFPHFACFRGRLYPMAAELNPQGNDPAKALLMFARGKPLGTDGLAWLCVRAANCWGNDDLDKLPLSDRVAWVHAHESHIRASAGSPLQHDWWSNAKEPWCFLATCFELTEAFGQGPAFVSHLPIPLDGSCNGLQHLAAMGRDRVGAMATNVVPGNDRRDIYSEVASIVARHVAVDAGCGHPQAQHWLGKIARKVVKRPVMTTPYGVTRRGMREQIIEDGAEYGFTEHIPLSQRGDAAGYLRDVLEPAIREEVPAATQIMAWLQSVAGSLAERDIPFSLAHTNRQHASGELLGS